MKRLLMLLGFLAVPVLFLFGQITIGLSLAFIWFVVRFHTAEKYQSEQDAVTNDLLMFLAQDIPAEEKQQCVGEYVSQVDANREKERKDWLYNLQNFGLKKDDPRWVK